MKPTALTAKSSEWLRAPLRGLFQLARGTTIVELLLATLMITLLSLALPIMLLHVYDRIIPNAALGTLGTLAVGVAGALLLETALRNVRGEVLARLVARAEVELHGVATERLLRTPTRILHQRGDGWYSERLHAISSLREACSGPVIQAALDLPFTVIYLGLIWSVGGPLAAVPAGLLVALLASGWLAGRRVRARAEALATLEERRLNFLFDVLRGFEALKSLGAEDLMERRNERLQSAGARLRRRLTEATSSSVDVGLLLSNVSTIGVAAWGASLVIEGHLTTGGLGASVMLAGRCLQPVVGGAALWSRLQAVSERARRVAELDALEAEEEASGRTLPGVGPRHVALNDVRFGRRIDGSWLLSDLSVAIAPGELVGIIGANGSGRSVLLKLMAGEIHPDIGRVMIDGMDVRSLDMSATRRHVTLVPQDPFLLQGTLLENVTLFDPRREEAGLEAAAAVGLDDVAATLPHGWHTPVGADGAPLTRGAIQQLGLARAMAMRPELLLLDEVTAHLDAETDQRFHSLLESLRGRCTVVMTSHRRSALARMDRRLVLARGRLEPWE